MRHNFRELKIWHKSRVLVKQIYLLSNVFPKAEMFGLTSQMRRASISISSNIAEGCGRGTVPQFKHFLDIAYGSACELETQVILSFDLNYLSEQQMNDAVSKIQELQKMIFSFKRQL